MTTARRLTPNDLRLIDAVLRVDADADIQSALAAKIAADARFHATMNGSAATPAERAAEIVDAFDAATPADFDRCREVIYRQRRELGCDSLPALLV